MKKMLRGIRRHEALLEEGGRFGNVAAAMIGSAVIGGAVSANSSSKATKAANAQSQAAVEASKGDPRMQAILYGNGSSPGLLNQIAGMANQNPQSANMQQFGNQFQNLIGQDGYNNWAKSNSAAQGLQGSNISAPQMQAASAQAPQSQWAAAQAAQTGMGQAPLSANSWTSAAQVGAPAQNGMNLNPAFNQMINGNAAENPYLTGAIQSGIGQSMEAFKAMQADATENLTENILPGIRSSSIMSGGFGGSRQALAEGGALGDFSKEMGRAMTNFGNANTGAALNIQSQAFNQGQDRALSAMGQLNGNQYGTAMQNAGFQQQANQQNSSQGLNNNQFNSGLLQQLLMGNTAYQQQANMANAGYQNQNNQFNAGLLGQFGLANGGWQQQANQNNQQAQQSTNALNSANQATGIGLAQGLGNQAFNWGQAQDNSQLNYLGQISGLLQGFTGFGTPTQQAQPYYSNTASSALGGAAAGLGLYNQFSQLGGNSGSSGYTAQDIRNTTSL